MILFLEHALHALTAGTILTTNIQLTLAASWLDTKYTTKRILDLDQNAISSMSYLLRLPPEE